MKPFIECSSVAAVIARDNVDTDMIVRIERMTTLKRGQFAPWAFEMLRYRADGSEDPGFVLNQAPFREAKILISGANFGCGSSREMAVWALDDFGIRCILAESYGDIFYNNCLQNGILPIRLQADELASLAAHARAGALLRVDLRATTVNVEGGDPITFEIPAQQREALLNGWDDIDKSLARSQEIIDFQQRDRRLRPWIYDLYTQA
ncbi:3-isopropylmalate dehydratase small subunit [Bordetella sp. 02P26C-1]|uniref:3-isopropylmalate dehydratase small subunit n=1 Tax=Bordetella sp. 02P26C-1 TaxID=2683195 RepID=UPI0013549F9B|nr:3-isopropylmalate dehydratase small subunit [Bordetella sp. 02P26C-1]MVW79475.1 3-isopropylmalate dehydratase small subunit [Bordetella sp. 02P26C-1]